MSSTFDTSVDGIPSSEDMKYRNTHHSSLSPRAAHMPQASSSHFVGSANPSYLMHPEENYRNVDDIQFGPIRYLNSKENKALDDDDDFMDDRDEEEIVQSLDNRAKFFGKFFRASFGSLSLILAVISLLLCIFREKFGFIRNNFIAILLHSGLITTYVLCTYRSLKSKRNIVPKQNSEAYVAEETHIHVYWANICVTILTFLGWSYFAITENTALSTLPWIRRLMIFLYAGLGPAMLFFTELSLTLMGDTMSEVTALWSHTQKFKSI